MCTNIFLSFGQLIDLKFTYLLNYCRFCDFHQLENILQKCGSDLRQCCSSKKDKVHDMDKSDVIYQVECKRHNGVYIGETERAMKARAYDHRVVRHEDTSINHSIEAEVRGRERTQQPRRSSGEVSEHMARYQDEHMKDDVSIKVI